MMGIKFEKLSVKMKATWISSKNVGSYWQISGTVLKDRYEPWHWVESYVFNEKFNLRNKS